MRTAEPLEGKLRDKIREDLEVLLGETLWVKANKGRKIVVENEAILEETYPHVFVVKVANKSSPPQRVSYSYADIITKTVELSFPDSNKYLFPWLYKS